MAERVLDPVCGMMVDPDRAAGHMEYKGTIYHFCSKGCAAKFTADRLSSGVASACTRAALGI